jgi:branched-chain amino acid transport system ATP-binding protein
MLELDGVSAGYGPVQALSAVSVRVMPGEIVTLIGANGAGKSTLLMTICGDPKPRAGRIVLEGKDIAGLPTHAIMRLGLAQSPEGRRVFPRMTVNENLVMGAETLGNGGDRSAVLEEVFALFPRLRERLSQRAGTLSGGEQQMLAIGRALMSRPRLLLLDEPSLGLAPLVVKQIFGAIRRLNAETGLTVLLVEQNANLALELADRAYLLETGRIVVAGPAADIRQDEAVRRSYLGY